jgi:S-adenosylmethionine/arginine decarboxylase-like enzyme
LAVHTSIDHILEGHIPLHTYLDYMVVRIPADCIAVGILDCGVDRRIWDVVDFVAMEVVVS